MELKKGHRRRLSNPLRGSKVDSDSYDSAAQKDLSGTNSAYDTGDTKKVKKTSKSISKGLRNLMHSTNNHVNGTRSSNKENIDKNNNSNIKSKVSIAPVMWRDLYKQSSSSDIMEEEIDDDDEVEDHVPKLPKGKKMVDVIVGTDVDTLYKSVFGNNTFFEIVNSKAYEDFKNYECSEWTRNRTSGLLERKMTYELSKTIAFTQHHVHVEQTQIVSGYSRKGIVYGVDTITESTGVAYSDYFRLNIHYRFLQIDDPSCSQLVVMVNIEFVKPCLFKNRIESEAWSGLKKYYDVVSNEVQLEKDLINDTIAYSKLLKDSYNRLNGVSQDENATPVHGEEKVYFSQTVLMISFMLMILVLFILTISLYKMNETISKLDTRVMILEESLERNSRAYQLAMQPLPTNE